MNKQSQSKEYTRRIDEMQWGHRGGDPTENVCPKGLPQSERGNREKLDVVRGAESV